MVSLNITVVINNISALTFILLLYNLPFTTSSLNFKTKTTFNFKKRFTLKATVS